MKEKASTLCAELSPMLEKLGYFLLDARSVHVHGSLKVYLTIYSAEGVGLSDCVYIHKTLLPRLEIVFASQDLALEVRSPGLEWKFTTFEQFTLFKGKHAKILLENEGWISGLITEADKHILVLNILGIMRELNNAQILQAQLLYKEK